MLALFVSIEPRTYFSRVNLTLEWPRISLRFFTSKPRAIALVAKVCLAYGQLEGLVQDVPEVP